MKIAVATDHAGFTLKEVVLQTIHASGHETLDLGTFNEDPVDYPDIAARLGQSILQGKAERGILLCGSGVGACMAANKIKGIYAGLCHDTYSARQGVEHDDMNVLCMGARVIGPAMVRELVVAYLNARFIGGEPGEERHRRRVEKIHRLESET